MKIDLLIINYVEINQVSQINNVLNLLKYMGITMVNIKAYLISGWS